MALFFLEFNLIIIYFFYFFFATLNAFLSIYFVTKSKPFYEFDLIEITCIKYALITSVDVKCSLFMYKNILSDNRGQYHN